MVHSSQEQHAAIAAQQQAVLSCVVSAGHIQVSAACRRSAPFCACSSLLWSAKCNAVDLPVCRLSGRRQPSGMLSLKVKRRAMPFHP